MTTLNRNRILSGVAIAALTLSAAAPALAGKSAPDLILTNGKVYTGDDASPWAEAVAVKGGRIVEVGAADKVMALKGKKTDVIDLEGRMAMAGISDAHSHPLDGAMKKLFQCNFPFSSGPDEIAAAISACVARWGDGEWIVGGQWDSNFFVNNKFDSPRKWLDKVSGDKAVVLIDDSGHNVWANSLALELTGITAETPDPEGGRYRREADGVTPNGVIEEAAAKAIRLRLPEASLEDTIAGVHEMGRMLNSFGITGVKIARAPEDHLAALKAVDKKDGLTLHVTASLETPYGPRAELLDIADLKRRRAEYASKNLNTNAVKIFLDGVPTASRTACMLDPYVPDEKFGADYHGEIHLKPEMLATDVTALDKEGFVIKIHTAGDGSVRAALDAIEKARKANGDSGERPELAHAGYVAESDIPRFAALNVSPDFSPYIWSPSPIIDSVVEAVGPRGEHYWPTRDLIDAGAVIIAGSDWPSAVETPNPWPGIETLVTRRSVDGSHEGVLWPEEAVSLAEAIRIFTHNSAGALGFDNVTGVLAPGADADIIVLDRNIFDVPAGDVGETNVLLTLFEGEPVYASGAYSSLVSAAK